MIIAVLHRMKVDDQIFADAELTLTRIFSRYNTVLSNVYELYIV